MTDSTEELPRANETMYKTIAQLRKENKIMREALERIALVRSDSMCVDFAIVALAKVKK